MVLKCTGAEPGEICEACKQAQDIADVLFTDMLIKLKNSGLSDMQCAQAAVNAGLWCVEAIIENNKEAQSIVDLAGSIGTEWFLRIDSNLESQDSELKKTNNVANIINNNGTVN